MEAYVYRDQIAKRGGTEISRTLKTEDMGSGAVALYSHMPTDDIKGFGGGNQLRRRKLFRDCCSCAVSHPTNLWVSCVCVCMSACVHACFISLLSDKKSDLES